MTRTSFPVFVTRAACLAGLHGEIGVRLVSDAEIQALNLRFRGHNAPTDVLSFPAGEGADPGYLGDIAISRDTARRQARAHGHSLVTETRILALHGLLHLAGYDHETDHGQMRRRERQLRLELGLPPGLTER